MRLTEETPLTLLESTPVRCLTRTLGVEMFLILIMQEEMKKDAERAANPKPGDVPGAAGCTN